MPEKRHKSGFRGPSPDVGKATQFKPGNSANPGGRPKRDLAAELSQLIFEGDEDAIVKAVPAIRKAMIAKLKKGDTRSFSAYAERGYGKVTQPVAGDPERPLEINVRIHRIGS